MLVYYFSAYESMKTMHLPDALLPIMSYAIGRKSEPNDLKSLCSGLKIFQLCNFFEGIISSHYVYIPASKNENIGSSIGHMISKETCVVCSALGTISFFIMVFINQLQLPKRAIWITSVGQLERKFMKNI